MMDRHTVRKLVNERRGMDKVRKYCDENDLPYPQELSSYLVAVQKYRSQ